MSYPPEIWSSPRGLRGEGAPLSASVIQRLIAQLKLDYEPSKQWGAVRVGGGVLVDRRSRI